MAYLNLIFVLINVEYPPSEGSFRGEKYVEKHFMLSVAVQIIAEVVVAYLLYVRKEYSKLFYYVLHGFHRDVFVCINRLKCYSFDR